MTRPTDTFLGLERGLKERHIRLIAIGGTIGVGLFLGSARAIQMAGPALIVNYVLAGITIFFLMRALGELMLYRPVAGSFSEYADEFVGPFAGFATGWSYWFNWVVTCMAELTAIGIYLNYWFPHVPQWVPAVAVLVILYGINLLAVKIFGEVEFWFSILKVFTIVSLLLIGTAVIVFKLGDLGKTAGVANLWSHGGFFPFGIAGMALTLQMVMFAYSGVEVVGLTAGEAQSPETVLPRATQSIIFRIGIFYIGSLIVIIMLIPWPQMSEDISPFVFVFEKIGIPGAAHFVNFVVITAAASSCNSGIFSTGRMLYSMGQHRAAPRAFAKISSNHVPVLGVSVSTAIVFIGVILNYFVPAKAFVWLTSVALVGTLWTWIIIMLAHIGYRRKARAGMVQAVAYRMPGYPAANCLVIAVMSLTGVLLWFDPETRVAIYVAPIWFGMLAAAYKIFRG
jgi:amino acid transporter, AAT family